MEQGPELQPIEQAQYQKDHQAWRAEQREMLRSVLPIRGIWPLPEGRAEANKLAGGENRLPVAVEAGLKRLPSAQGYVDETLTN
jgi:hypothetical protein